MTAVKAGENDGRNSGDEPPDDDETRMLLAFVHDRDATCPACGYNLRNLTRPICPECRQELILSVGLRKPPEVAYLVLTLAPGIFSGICTVLIVGTMLIIPGAGGQGPIPPGAVLLLTFGALSGLTAAGLLLARHRFVRLGRDVQIWCAIVTWAVHVMLFFIIFGQMA
ncbi:MAG: hypothetical protein SYC29_03515 [Planctomycetota bacterium]|nr:hypothetical protein [Planctomycetota bacterium]